MARRAAARPTESAWGGIVLSPNGVWGVLRRHGLSRRARRLALVAGYAAPPEPARPPHPVRHIAVRRPGELVQMDCVCIGRLSGTRGTVWQYTAIDAYSSYLWAELATSSRNPLARHTWALAERVAAELAARGWRLQAITSDNGSEFTSRDFGTALAERGVVHRRIPAGRPQSNGFVERVQLTILDECCRTSPQPFLWCSTATTSASRCARPLGPSRCSRPAQEEVLPY